MYVVCRDADIDSPELCQLCCIRSGGGGHCAPLMTDNNAIQLEDGMPCKYGACQQVAYKTLARLHRMHQVRTSAIDDLDVCQSHPSGICKNSWTDWRPVWGEDDREPKKDCIMPAAARLSLHRSLVVEASSRSFFEALAGLYPWRQPTPTSGETLSCAVIEERCNGPRRLRANDWVPIPHSEACWRFDAAFAISLWLPVLYWQCICADSCTRYCYRSHQVIFGHSVDSFVVQFQETTPDRFSSSHPRPI